MAQTEVTEHAKLVVINITSDLEGSVVCQANVTGILSPDLLYCKVYKLTNLYRY